MGCNNFAWRVSCAIIGLVVGVSAGAAFGVVLHNPDAGAFGLFSGITAAVALTVHILYRRDFWTYDAHSSLIRFMYTGCFVQLAGVIGFVVYMIFGCMYQTDKLVVENRSFFLTCVWCFMTWKWGFLLFFYSRKYRRELTKQDSIRILDGQ